MLACERQKMLLTVSLLLLSSAQYALLPCHGRRRILPGDPNGPPIPAIVFVSRQIPWQGSVYWSEPRGLPGVGPWSRFQVASPGRLLILEPNGCIRVLVDGANPNPASLNLVDVNAPDVSYDGTQIVFAGLPAGQYDKAPDGSPGAWRIYAINLDGTGLNQLTFSDQDDLDLSQFEEAQRALEGYDDTDPVWLPDGRIVFSSTRWPSLAQYSGVRTTNLQVLNPDGTLRRITHERNGADRPLIDPLTGKIVYARWWRNHRFASDSMTTITRPGGGFVQYIGLTMDRDADVGGPNNLWRNAWHAAAINPDGTRLEMWAGAYREDLLNHVYGGAFTPDGILIANFFPMYNMTEAGGFGGLRRYRRGPGLYESIIGVTALTTDYVSREPPSYGILRGVYACDPAPLPDGRLLISWAPDIGQDYGLNIIEADGSGRFALLDFAGTSELRAKLVLPRSLPPILADTVVQAPSMLPPSAEGPYDRDGTFVFQDFNVYFNAPVDTEIVNAPAVGSAAKIRFFVDHQRTSPGSFPYLDWPILLGEQPVNSNGSVFEPNAPANVPLFEQLRSADGKVPLTSRASHTDGAAHVAGMNFGQSGTVVRCVGCHAGHSMIPLPDPAEAEWTNLAPGAEVSVSSSHDPKLNRGLVDRQVLRGEIWSYWNSFPGEIKDQWVQLTFPVPIKIRIVRLYNPRKGDEAKSTLQAHAVTIKLYADAEATKPVAVQKLDQDLAVSGTDVRFGDVVARAVRINIDSISGTFCGARLVSLAEIEVIGSGNTTR